MAGVSNAPLSSAPLIYSTFFCISFSMNFKQALLRHSDVIRRLQWRQLTIRLLQNIDLQVKCIRFSF